MNPLAGRVCERVWHRTGQRWGRYVGPDPADPASTCFVVWADGDDPVREDVEDLLTADHPSAGQVNGPDDDTIEVQCGLNGSTDPTFVAWYRPGRRVENRRAEAYHITRTLVGAGLADWAEASYGAAEPARTERGAR